MENEETTTTKVVGYIKRNALSIVSLAGVVFVASVTIKLKNNQDDLYGGVSGMFQREIARAYKAANMSYTWENGYVRPVGTGDEVTKAVQDYLF
jgi:hypothetical protein